MTDIFYITLAFLAVSLNIKNSQNLNLLFLVIFTYFFPTQHIHNWYWWYAAVITLDLMILYASMKSDALASKCVLIVTSMMLNAHFLEISTEVPTTYKFIIQYLEHLQIVCFILCAPSPIEYFKRKVKRWIKQFGYGH